jgi:hypothetical protein
MSTRTSDEAGTKTGFTGIWIHGKPRVAYRFRSDLALPENSGSQGLTARGNLAFIATQMGHRDYSMLVENGSNRPKIVPKNRSLRYKLLI